MTKMILNDDIHRVSTVLIFLVILLAFGSEAHATAQRMLLMPTGDSIAIAGGGNGKLPAMCLDEHRNSPKGERFFAPVALGSATVIVGAAPPIPLQEAIDRKILKVEGDGDYVSLEVTSLVSEPLAIRVASTSVVVPEDSTDIDDLAGLPFIDQKNPSFSQDELWRESSKAQLIYRGWQENELSNLQSRRVALSYVLKLLDQGWSKEDIITYGKEVKDAGALRDRGWEEGTIRSFSGNLSSILYLLDEDWTENEIKALRGEVTRVVELVVAGWSKNDVGALQVDLPHAVRLAREGWGVDEINSIRHHLDAAAALAEGGLYYDQIQKLGQHIEYSAKLAEWASAHGQDLDGNLLFPLQRITIDGIPLYLLFSPQGEVLYVEGNQNLDEVGIFVRDEMFVRETAQTPGIVLVGEGGQGDFDAAQMTVWAADAGGGGGKTPIEFLSLPAGFPPGDGGNWNYSTRRAENLQVAVKAGSKRSKVVSVSDRGNVTISVSALLIDKWYSFLSAMHVGVKDAEAEPGATTMSRADLESAINRHIQLRIDQEKNSRKMTEPLPEGAADAEFDLDKELTIRTYVEIAPAPLVRFAENSGDGASNGR